MSNHLGIDMYTHNRATRRYGGPSTADLTPPQPADCPFCGKRTVLEYGRLGEHIERLGFTRCPGSGCQPVIAAQRAASLTADYRLASEGLWDD